MPLLQSTPSQTSTSGDGVMAIIVVATVSTTGAEGVMRDVIDVSGIRKSVIITTVVVEMSIEVMLKMSVSKKSISPDVLPGGARDNTLEGSGRRENDVSGMRVSSELVGMTTGGTLCCGVADEGSKELVGKN